MNIGLGTDLALATHLNAYLAGHSVQVDMDCSWFRKVQSCSFTRGEELPPVATSIEEWFQWMAVEGGQSAYLWLDPLYRTNDDLKLLKFSGHRRWGPCVAGQDFQVLWQMKATVDKSATERPWRLHYGGFQPFTDRDSVRSSVPDAFVTVRHIAQKLKNYCGDSSLLALVADRMERVLDASRNYELGQHHPYPPSVPLFPKDLYPLESYALVDIVGLGWIFSDALHVQEIEGLTDSERASLDALTLELWTAYEKCLYAASNVLL